MKHLILFFLLFIISETFLSCNSSNQGPKQDFNYIPLKEYHFKHALINPGTEVQLLAFSGGQPNGKNAINYYQFIVVNKSTGDTIRILTPLISINESDLEENKTYTTPLQFDPKKGITTGFYELIDSAQNLLLQTDLLVDQEKPDTSVDVRSLMDHINMNEYVVINKSMPVFENSKYDAAIGIINFKQMPW